MKRLTLAYSLICFVVSAETTVGHTEDSILKVRLPNMIKSAEVKYGIPQGLLTALIQVESAGKITAINHDDGNKETKQKGLKVKSHGLVQIQLGTARMIQAEKAKSNGNTVYKRQLITTKQLMQPETNIEYGAMYLAWLLENHNNDVSWALTCYNAGPYSKLCKNKIYYGRYIGKVFNAWINSK